MVMGAMASNTGEQPFHVYHAYRSAVTGAVFVT